MPVTKKPVQRKTPQKKEMHYCTQNEAINRINLILVGNGDPKTGVLFKVVAMTDMVDTIHSNIEKISLSINGLAEKYENNLIATQKATSAFEIYKSENQGILKGKEQVIQDIDKSKEQSRTNFLKKLQVVGTIIATLSFLVMAYFQYANYNRTKTIKAEVERIDNTKDNQGDIEENNDLTVNKK